MNTIPNHNRNYLGWIDCAKTFAIIGVIVIHVAGTALYQYGVISNASWWTSNIFDSASRFSVPLFVMITGSLLLKKGYEWRDYYQLRFSRLIPPFIFWAFIYLLFHLFVNIHNHNIENNSEQIYQAFRRDILNGISPHFWFTIVLIGIVALIPLLRLLIVFLGRRWIIFILVLWIFFLAFMQFSNNSIVCNWFTYFLGFIGFALLGYLLTDIKITSIYNMKFMLIFFVLTGVLSTVLGTAWLTSQKGYFDDMFYSYLSLNVVLVAFSIFLLMQNLRIITPKPNKVFYLIGKHTYGIYFIHILILWFLGKAGIRWSFINPIVGIPLTTFLCFIISFLLLYLLNKLPFGKYISG